MQTLGLSDSTPRTENRLKSFFWPSIQTATDVDYLGTQGYWVCVVVGVVSFLLLLLLLGQPLGGIIVLLFYFLSGVGVRERSRYAATMVFLVYILEIIASGVTVSAGLVIRVIFLALLFSNMRATWIASKWVQDSPEAVFPPRLNETLGDKLADALPQVVWPGLRFFYYFFSAAWMALVVVVILNKGK
jgi:hypothetical protein